jgi:hypothetical protein
MAMSAKPSETISLAERETLSQFDQLKAGPKARILIHERASDLEIKTVYVGINGVDFWMRRGEEVTVPVPVALRLEQAMRAILVFDPDTNAQTTRQAPAYPFTWIDGRPTP